MAAQGQVLAAQCTRIAGCSTRADDGCTMPAAGCTVTRIAGFSTGQMMAAQGQLLATQCTRIAGCRTWAGEGCERTVVGCTVHKDSWLQHKGR
jgi:hypothetical protein